MAKHIFQKKEKAQVSEPVIKEPEAVVDDPFITTDSKLVEKLQDKFSIKSISYDRETELRTFIFNATRPEVETFIGGKDANTKL